MVDRQCGGDRHDARRFLRMDPCGRVERSLGLHPERIASEHDHVYRDDGERPGRLSGARLGSCAGRPTFSVDLGADTTLCGPVAFELTVDPWQSSWVAGWGTTGGAFSLISGPNAVIQLFDTAAVSVEVIDSLGCLATDTILIEVVPAPSPFDILQVGNTLCVPTGPFIYAWELNWNPIPGGDGPCTDVVINGLYSVVVSNALGCTEGDTAYFFVTQLDPTAREAPQNWYDAASGTLILGNTDRIDLLQVHDPTGRLLFERRNIPARSLPIDLPLTSDGIHLVTIRTQRESSILRIAVF
ncbi:MAG: hypothetical protein IPI07_17390 [Flavobacteriales bacterium]|nr:hypothetical protein [Flavobacteriales bacterium]